MAAPTTSAMAPGVSWITDEIDAGSATPPCGGTDRRAR